MRKKMKEKETKNSPERKEEEKALVCDKCGKPIETENGEEWIEFNGRKYHFSCFGSGCRNGGCD